MDFSDVAFYEPRSESYFKKDTICGKKWSMASGEAEQKGSKLSVCTCLQWFLLKVVQQNITVKICFCDPHFLYMNVTHHNQDNI